MVAPPLILLGQPILPMLRGLPNRILKEGLGPFLAWRGLRRAVHFVTHPAACWLSLTAAIVFWHVPRWYELGLTSHAWHGLEHASFFYAALLFWWPVIQVWPSHAQWPRWMMIPYLVLADFVNTALSAWLVFSTHVVYRTYELAPRLGSFSALDDQSTAGAIMWVPGSIAYLIPAFALTMQVMNGERLRRMPGQVKPVFRPAARASRFDLLRVPLLGRVLRYRQFRRVLQFSLFALALATVIDGWFGPQIAPLNLAGVLPWTYWRGFAVIALLAAGNFFCMACPFMLPRNVGRYLLPARYRWPRRLRSKWLAIGLLVLYFWAYEVFSLWSSPWWTAWIIMAYFITAFVIDGLFRGANFCKFVCPIGQFHFVHALVSPLEVEVRSRSVCGSCRSHDCIRGNETQRGCELHLFQPRKAGNFDCTFCLECVQACPQDNIGILAIFPGSAVVRDRHSSGIGRLSKRTDAAALAWILIFAALVNAAAMVDPVRDWMHAVAMALGLRSTLPVTTGLFLAGMIALPFAAAWLCGSLTARLGRVNSSWVPPARTFGFALIPLGFSMWVAHFVYHLATGWRSLIPVFERIFHISTSGANLTAMIPSWLSPVQILLLDAGLVLTIYIAWRTARHQTAAIGAALGIVAPWVLLAFGFYAASIWIVFQPMQMRGMVM